MVKGRVSTYTQLPSDIEQVIASLRNVLSARVVVAEDAIDEIHVLADTGRPAKWIVRDVETALAAKFGVRIDHRKVSVAQLESQAGKAPTDQRLVLTALKVELTPVTSIVHVELMWGAQPLSGVCEGPRNEQGRVRLAGQATLSALTPLLKDGVVLTLDQLETVTVGARRVCLSSVLFSARGQQERLLGTALVDSDPLEPAVKATLDAVNRRLGFMVVGC